LINGETCPLTVLKSIGDAIIDLHGQHDHQMLLNENAPYLIIDKIKDTATEKLKFSVSWENFCVAEKNLNLHLKKTEELKKKEDFLRFEYESINKLDLHDNEEENLEQEFTFLSSISQRLQNAAQISDILNGNENSTGVIFNISNLIKLLQNMTNIDKSFENWADEIKPLSDSLKELSKIADKYENSAIEENPAKLEEINDRIAKIQRLKKKYSCTFEELLQKRDELLSQLANIENSDSDKIELEKTLSLAKNEMETSAKNLSDARKRICILFDKSITYEMSKLGFNDGAFLTQFRKKEKIDANGIDEIIFTVKTNAGEPYLALNKTASGGEISRIMLAVKTVLAENDTIPIMVFDEIDTGIGGERATDIAAAIKKLARNHQILVISHLHQIASQADFHYFIFKTEINGRTETKIEKLNNFSRIKEIARMLGGENEITLRHAKELLGE
jgi:DNA repair protein RecN (Recombination protein N)